MCESCERLRQVQARMAEQPDPLRRAHFGRRIDFSKYGRCRFCITWTIVGTLTGATLLFSGHTLEWDWLFHIGLVTTILFSLNSAGHLIGYIQARRDRAENPDAEQDCGCGD